MSLVRVVVVVVIVVLVAVVGCLKMWCREVKLRSDRMGFVLHARSQDLQGTRGLAGWQAEFGCFGREGETSRVKT